MCKIMLSTFMAQRTTREVIEPASPSSSQKKHRMEKETIHSGHFMVSQFEADAQDDEYEVAVPVPEVSSKKLEYRPSGSGAGGGGGTNTIEKYVGERRYVNCTTRVMSVSIETSLSKLFQCMSIAYRQKLTSPKWNRFKGVRLRWKEKIRLNNVIWRCWHMQFVKKRNIGVCQFALPLDVDVHSKPEAVVLEGKYWKRKLSAVTAEYKRWRIFYQKHASSTCRENDLFNGMMDWNSCNVINDCTMMVDEDYMNFMSDTLFSTITSNQPFAFPDTREIARGASIADFIQPSLVQLQPNLDDYMDMLEPLQDLLSSPSSAKLPSVPEEYQNEDLYRSLNINYETAAAVAAASSSSSSGYYHQQQQQHHQQQQNSSTIPNESTNAATSNEKDSHQRHMQQQQSAQFYVKCEQEQPLQLSVTQQQQQQHDMCSKMAYRNNNVYAETTNRNSSSSSSSYTNHNGSNSYSGYQMQQQQQQQQQVYQSQPTHHPGQDSTAVNYSYQTTNSNVKNVPSSPISINFNASSIMNNQNYVNYDTNMAYSAPVTNMQSYNPTSSSNYKMLPTSRSARSGSLTTNSMDEEIFAVPKLSQRGRSRSGSSLLSYQSRYVPSEQIGDSSNGNVSLTQLLINNRHYGCHGGYHFANSNGYGCPLGGDGRTCYTINEHRQVAHCTALLGRRSRTPDHILSSNSNPVGYCRPRVPALPSQNGEDLINLSSDSNKNEEDEKNDPMCGGGSGVSSGSSSYSYSKQHSSQCGGGGGGVKSSNNEKYHNSSHVHNQTWSPSSSAASVYQSSSGNGGGTNTPFIFGVGGGNSSETNISNVSQIISNANSSESPKHPSSPSTSESLSLSPLTVSSPIRITPPSPTTRTSHNAPYREHRRVNHINAEHKRRCNIKNGFDTLHMLIPHLVQNPNTKMSKAAMLQQGADYIRQLRSERAQLRDEIESLKQQVDTLNSSISNCQSLLPATGAPVSRHKADKIREMYDEYVKERTKQNWKFWILSLICEPLLTSFNSSVSTSSYEELFRTAVQWAEQYCSLVDLRPIVLNALRHVCTNTEILTSPNQLPDETRAIVFTSQRTNNRN